MTDNNGRNTAGRFKAGNPGKPQGARNKATALAQKLLHDSAGRLTEVAIDLALQGDPSALKMCLARILPPVKDVPVNLALPAIGCAYEASFAATDVLAAVASGELTLAEGQAALTALETYARISDVGEIEARLAALEDAVDRR